MGGSAQNACANSDASSVLELFAPEAVCVVQHGSVLTAAETGCILVEALKQLVLVQHHGLMHVQHTSSDVHSCLTGCIPGGALHQTACVGWHHCGRCA
jgi:hypothetical protein